MFERSTDGADDRAPQRLSWIVAFFVLSGLTGLIYQSTWTQYLGLVLGSAAYAQSLVLAIFMGGMAIGSWIASRYAERMRNLLVGYGVIEGAIGVFALVFHVVFVYGTRWLYDSAIPQLGSPDAIGLARWTFAALTILPQTILLGMTFPIMSAGLMRWLPERAGAILGGLYFLNSAGAALGALVATFVLVPYVGLPGALAFAGVLNLLIFGGVLYARFPSRDPRAGAAAASAARDGADVPFAPTAQLPLLVRFMLVGAGLTGLSSFMYEIGWVRMLSLALGSSLHAFELMLAAFIGGLALGALWVRRRLDTVADPLRFVGWVQVLMGVAALATLPLYDNAFAWVSWLMHTLAKTPSGYFFYNFATAAISIAIMLPAAFFAGTTLPAMTYVLLRNGARERVMGQIYSANTLGAIVGVMVMMHWALPALGLKFSMIVAASIDLVLGLVVLFSIRGRSLRTPAFATGLAAAAVVLAVVAADFDPRKLNAGVYRSGVAELASERTVMFNGDGKTASIALHGQPGRIATISTNGKPDAALSLSQDEPYTQDEPTMIMAALLGLAYRPDAKDIANIGFGSGLTTHTFAASPAPQAITTVEIEPLMVEAAKGFGARVERAYTDPRSHIVIDDARAYFSGQRAHYDIIVSEPSNPWVSGVARLFSQEFYRFVRRHLRDEGLLVQWVQGYEISDATVMTLLRALDSSFADYAVYLSAASDMLIVASPNGALPEPSGAFLDDASVRELAEIAGIRRLPDLVERRLADRRVLHAMLEVDGGPANSDFFPILAHEAPRDRYTIARPYFVLNLHDSPMGIFSFLNLYPRNDAQAWRKQNLKHPIVDARRSAEGVYAGLYAQPLVGGTDADLLWHGVGARLREIGTRCFRGDTPNEAVSLLVRAFQTAAPFLDDARLRQSWSTRDWIACDGAPEPAAAAMLAVLDAAVRADGATLAPAVETMLTQHRATIDPDLQVFVAYAGLYAAHLVGDAALSTRWFDEAMAHMKLTPRGKFRLRTVKRVLDDTPSSLPDTGVTAR